MRCVVQRVLGASVRVDGETVASIDRGLLVLVGMTQGDGLADVETMADKLVHLRVFGDAQGLMNRSVAEIGGAILLVSQFTLYGDARRGRRPSFTDAARPKVAEPLFDSLVASVAEFDIPVATGRFGASMEVELINDGPITLLLESSGGRLT